MVHWKRHFAKSITWRALGTLDTMAIAWIVTGDPLMGLSIGALEVFTKTLLYYLHERVWYNVSDYGVDKNETR